MALMQEKLYRALIAGGASDDVAREAAVEAAEINELKSVARLHSWMLGTVVALQIATFFLVLQIYGRLQ